MKSLRIAPAREELQQRIARVTPSSQRLWGRMTAHQMICHLADGFRIYMGELSAKNVETPAPRWIIKNSALWMPLPWPHGFKTMPEIDQQAGAGTPPAEFARDVEDLRERLNCFAQLPRDFAWKPHPVFGLMSYREWMRLGYLHCDHHLRQFGA